jgi:phosphorylcholine metabolism protein LicD
MPIEYLDYTPGISSTMLRNLNDKIGIYNFLLKKVKLILNEHNIPFYLDCGTLLGCIRDNAIMEHDTDIDVTTHLSMWDKLKAIDFTKYDLIIKRIEYKRVKSNVKIGDILSVKTKYGKYYCDIYLIPAFPILSSAILNGETYPVPIEPELYITQLYGNNWKIPSGKHASWTFHRYSGLVKSPYKKNWNMNYEIFTDLLY